MAVKYVKSTTGSDANGGTSWADAYATVAKALSVVAAGDTTYVSQSHAETQATTITWTSPGTAASPCLILCVNDGATPPTATATTATVTTTSTGNFALLGHTYVYGISIISGSGSASQTDLALGNTTANHRVTLDTCKLQLGNTGTASRIITGNVSVNARETFVELINTTVQFGNASQAINNQGSKFYWKNTASAIAGATLPTTLFIPVAGSTALAEISGIDLSALGSGKNLVTASNTGPNRFYLRNCRLGASVTIITGTITSPGGVEVYLENCDSSNTNYRMEHYKYQGKILNETTDIMTAGASDGTTVISHKFTSLTTGPNTFMPLWGPWMTIWNDTSGSSKTVTVEILHDSLTNLQDADIYLEIEGLGTASFPESVYYTNRVADVFASAADHAAGTGTGNWTTSGLTNPNSQKLVKAFTPQVKGPIRARVCLIKSNYTVFVNPVLTIS